MKWRYAVIVVFIGIVIYLICIKNRQAKRQLNDPIIIQTARPLKVPSQSGNQDPDNTYKDLRNLAFNATTDQIGVEFPHDTSKIYGVIMDWGLEEGTATLVAFLSGEVSLYLSTGGGIIGSGRQDNVKQAAIVFVNDAENYLNKTIKTSNTLLTVKDGVKFYFLTSNGIFSGEERMENLNNNNSAWSNLFEQANKLITAIRTTPAVEQSN